VGRVEPDFVPAALALGSGIHGAAAFVFQLTAPVPTWATSKRTSRVWTLETDHWPLRFGE
jgi:hypothetical protein